MPLSFQSFRGSCWHPSTTRLHCLRGASALLPSERSGSSVGSGSQGPSSFAGDDTVGTSPGLDDVGNDQAARVDTSTLAVSAPPAVIATKCPFAISPNEPASS